MQFKRSQRGLLQKNWSGDSWFYTNLGSPARSIIACAYGLEDCPPKIRTRCQEDVTIAMAVFARAIGCDKSHAVHSLLTGSIKSLKAALHKSNVNISDEKLRSAWEAAFRDINVGQSGEE